MKEANLGSTQLLIVLSIILVESTLGEDTNAVREEKASELPNFHSEQSKTPPKTGNRCQKILFENSLWLILGPTKTQTYVQILY